MTEEEIIKLLNYQTNMKGTDVYTPINYDAIQGLLDLYNKQKEEIKRLKIQLKTQNGISYFTHKQIVESDYVSKDELKKVLIDIDKFDTQYEISVYLQKAIGKIIGKD